MNSLVIYGSRHGNTQKIAYGIAAGLRRAGPVQVLPIDEAAPAILSTFDLVVIGGPTEAHQMTQPVVQFFDKLGPDVLEGKFAAAFDTRLRWPGWLSGSAAAGIATRIRQAGAEEVLRPESFFVAGQPAELVPGELDRAESWAQALALIVEANRRPAVSVGLRSS